MTTSISRGCIVVLLVFSFGCGAASNLGGSGASATDIAAVYDEAADILKTVTDKPTAEEASPKLAKVGAKLKKRYDAALKKYPDLATDISKMPEDEQKKLKQAHAHYQEEHIRVLNLDDGGSAIQAFSDATGRIELGLKDKE